MARSKGRTGRPWRRASAAVRARAAGGDPCWLCRHPIDLRLPPRHPLAFSVDHRVPLSRGGDPLAPTNLEPAHMRCNSRRGNASRRPTRALEQRGQTVGSRAW